MNDNKTTGKKARSIMPATRILQSRVGAGKIKPEKIEKAQGKMNAVRGRIDLQPFAQEHMGEIRTFMAQLKASQAGIEITDEIARSIMKFKGNIGIFSEGPLIGLTMIMLDWVESIETIDQDVMDVLNGYSVTLEQIFSDKLKDTKMIEVIIKEMQAACERYFSRHPELQLTQVIDNSKAFYIDQSDHRNVKIGLDISDELHDDKLIGNDD
jgi:hypothetical protein